MSRKLRQPPPDRAPRVRSFRHPAAFAAGRMFTAPDAPVHRTQESA